MGSQYSSLCSSSKPFRRLFVIAIRCRVHTFQRTASRVCQNLLQRLLTSVAAHLLLRTCGSCRSIARSSLMSQHAVVYGQNQTQIKDEQERVQKWIEGMTEDLLRLKRNQYAQPHWMNPMMNPLQPSPPSCPSQPACSSSASTVPVKPAPLNRNPSMASAPANASFPSSMGMDPWAEAKMKRHR